MYGDIDGPDLSDARGDEDRADDLQEQTIAAAFDRANPAEAGADDNSQETFRPRLDQSKERHNDHCRGQEVCPEECAWGVVIQEPACCGR
jgi:hypothetical protein